MKDEEDWEWYYWETNPSPMEDVYFMCPVPFCRLVLDYHAKVWRTVAKEDGEKYRRHGAIMAHCPDHYAQIKQLEKEQEEDK